jgi:hypothetical protein
MLPATSARTIGAVLAETASALLGKHDITLATVSLARYRKPQQYTYRSRK